MNIMNRTPNTTEPDQFKHFRTDPPEVKLEAWRLLQARHKVCGVATAVGRAAIAAVVLLLPLWAGQGDRPRESMAPPPPDINAQPGARGTQGHRAGAGVLQTHKVRGQAERAPPGAKGSGIEVRLTAASERARPQTVIKQ